MAEETLDLFFHNLWQNYTAVCPGAEKIQSLIRAYNGCVVNDHLALRTFDQGPVSIARLQPVFERLGYHVHEEYNFTDRKLRGKAFLHDDPDRPKILLSELLVDQLSSHLQALIKSLLLRANLPGTVDENLFLRGRLWPMISWDDYRQARAESDYAAWLCVMGFCAHHFAVYVNRLETNDCLDEVIELIQSLGIPLDESGGLIKGNALVGLQQASTLPDRLEVAFADGTIHSVDTCFYEFALRYPDERGNLYQGFAADSADDIPELTQQKLVGA